jgi:hypothetical protein
MIKKLAKAFIGYKIFQKLVGNEKRRNKRRTASTRRARGA